MDATPTPAMEHPATTPNGSIVDRWSDSLRVNGAGISSNHVRKPEWRRLFLRDYAKHGVLTRAARAAGVAYEHVLRTRARNDRFARACRRALASASLLRREKAHEVEDSLYDQAVNGDVTHHYRKGELVSTSHRRSPQAGIAYLKANLKSRYDRASKQSAIPTVQPTIDINAIMLGPDANAAIMQACSIVGSGQVQLTDDRLVHASIDDAPRGVAGGHISIPGCLDSVQGPDATVLMEPGTHDNCQTALTQNVIILPGHESSDTCQSITIDITPPPEEPPASSVTSSRSRGRKPKKESVKSPKVKRTNGEPSS